ncbi:staphylococcal nuclease domain-containing protein 1-like [Oppia nitens]|uniref:staphylococcal nuclease domain-containing protein 1-like n=1 Tax=Oppia nitens TaxID=1686743 RepID=UPI0023DC2207|nr:staphylococcal nuclease domain-containing protein 1-like [Oppia nitens]
MANPVTQSSPQRAIVKMVVSGDSLIIRGQPKGGPPPEKQINLAYVMAPKVGRKLPDGTTSIEEPYGWESREYLRKKLVGKEVLFKSEYKIQMGNAQREFGILMCGDENINQTVVNEGTVEVNRREKNKDNEDVIKLVELEESAKNGEKGKWGKLASGKREVLYEVEEPQKLVNKSLIGIVEHVRDGSTLRVALQLESNKKYQNITLMLSGIRCPQASEPFGEEARYFTESRLLQKDVNVRIEQTSGGGNSSAFVGSVTIGDKNIAEYLIKEGFAKCIDWTIGLTEDPKKLRNFEREAKSKKSRIWKDYKDAPKTNGSNDSFEARVLEIVSGDALVVQNLTTNEDKKIFIASIRPPRPEGTKTDDDNKDRKQFRPLYDIPHMFDAREFLRKRLIGKKISVKVDYIQPKTDNFQEKICCTVVVDNNINIGEALISKGLATVVRYRQDDDQRASAYDSFLAAESKAQKSNKGLYSNNKDAGIVRIVDLSTDQSKAKNYSTFLLRNQNDKKSAVVEFVFPSSSKLKLYVPKDNCLLNLILVGVSSPKSTDPIGIEALRFVKQRIHQRDVQISVEAIDKVGNFIGWVYYEHNNSQHNLAVDLIRNGYASVRESSWTNELSAAEAEAKKQKIGIWKDYKEEEHTEALEEAINEEVVEKDTSDLDKRKKVVVTNISSGLSSFHAQYVEDGPKLEELLTELREELTSNPPLPGAYKPTKGDLVVAKFSVDQQWYRAKIEKIVSNNEIQVIYTDYGNRETISSRSIAAMPSSKFTSLGPAAKEYALAFVRLDTDPDFVNEVRNAFSDETADRVLLLKSEYKDASGLEAVTLLDEESKKDIVLQLVSDGLFFVDIKSRRERRLQKTLNEYKGAQESAKKKRLNIWQYGDITEDDAKEFGYPNA